MVRTNKGAVLPQGAAPIRAGPRSWESKSMSEYEPDGSEFSGEETCPWDGCDYTSTPNGVKVHHGKAHGESIAGVPVECDWCGDVKRVKKNVAEQDKRHFCDQECWGAWASENVSGEDHHQHKEKVVVECAACGAMAERHESQTEGRDRYFCDYECMGEWLEGRTGPRSRSWEGGPVITDCTNCGASVAVKRSRHEEGNRYFCSRACCNEWQVGYHAGEDHPLWEGGKITVHCSYCDAAFETHPAWAKQYEHHYCDKECMAAAYEERFSGKEHPSWKGGEFPYGEGWTEAKKEEVRERQDRECAGCGTHESTLPRKLDVHHIQKARSFDDDEARNDDGILIAVCQPCHKTFEKLTPLRPQTPHFDD